MQGRPEINEGSVTWALTEAVFARHFDAESIDVDEAPSAEQPLLQEMRLIARVIAAHEERQQTPDASGGTSAADDQADHKETWDPLVILEKIGEGTFGEVFRAREPRLDRQVALKFFRPNKLSVAQMTSDVIEEGRLLARVHHPNVVSIYGAKYLNGKFGIWMEFIEGTTLEDIVTEQGPRCAVEAMEICRELGQALTALHAAGILHRDIKARNVMREHDGRVVLMDLGISCEIDHEIPVRQYGTPLYAAPEALLSAESSPQGDIYSLGVLLYFLVSGRYPVTGSTLADIHAAHETGRRVSLASEHPGLPSSLLHIVDKALATDPAERYKTASELNEALDEALREVARPQYGAARSGSPTNDRQAYNHYLQGRHFFNQRYQNGLPKAIDCFRQAIARDPNFALAHVGVADCLSHLSYQNYLRPREGFAKARAIAEHALELEPDLGEVHATFGWISMFFDWDFEASEEHFKRALQLCPQYPLARQWYALMLSSRGRNVEALAEIESGRDLDPSALIMSVEAVVLLGAGFFQEAIPLFQMAAETEPESWYHNTQLGMATWFGGQRELAEAPLRKAIQISKGSEAFAVALLAHVLIHTQREDEAHGLIEHMDALARQRPLSYYHRMTPWIELGRYDKWGPLLKSAIEERDSFLSWIRPIIIWKKWLADPRFADPLRKAGLVE